MPNSQNQYEEWHNDPDNWKWGIFYFNSEDDRIFVPKRSLIMGFTLNFANPYSATIILGFGLLFYAFNH